MAGLTKLIEIYSLVQRLARARVDILDQAAREARLSQVQGSSALKSGVLGSAPAVALGCAAAAEAALREAPAAGGWG